MVFSHEHISDSTTVEYSQSFKLFVSPQEASVGVKHVYFENLYECYTVSLIMHNVFCLQNLDSNSKGVNHANLYRRLAVRKVRHKGSDELLFG